MLPISGAADPGGAGRGGGWGLTDSLGWVPVERASSRAWLVRAQCSGAGSLDRHPPTQFHMEAPCHGT
jgi:hypothetical protein